MGRHGIKVDVLAEISCLAYQKMCDTHLLLANAILAEGKYTDARQVIEKALPYVSSVPQDRASMLLVLVKSWIGER